MAKDSALWLVGMPISWRRRGVYRVGCSAVIGPGGPGPLDFPGSLAVGKPEEKS